MSDNAAGDNLKRWYVVQTQHQRERLAREHLKKQGFDVFLPLFPRMVSHARIKRLVYAPLFPDYLFVRFDPMTMQWRRINGTVGVHRLMCLGDERPGAVPTDDVDRIQAYVDELEAERGRGRVKANHSFKQGQVVRVKEGVFEGFQGLCDKPSRDRQAVILDIFGRSTVIQFPLDQLEHAD